MSFLFNLLTSMGSQVYIYMAIAFGGFGAGFYIEHLRFADFESKVALEAQKQIDANTAKKKEQEIINDNVKKTYQANVDNIHNFYSSLHNASSGSMSYNANSTVAINGKTIDILLVAEQCAQTTQQLITLQDWIYQQVGLNDQ
jgi:hypothetical protein